MKPIRILLSAAALAACLAATAQTTFEEMAADLNKCGGVYYAYPVAETQATPVPEGYEPFYVSHFSRHGSRYLISDKDLDEVVAVFERADSNSVLSPLGKDVMGRLHSFQEEMRGRGGELTPLGVRQHRGIATRMYDSFPGVFDNDAELTAVSTPVMRCAYSMLSFCEALKEKNPSLVIPKESSPRHLRYLNYHSKESGEFNDRPETDVELKKFRAEMTRPDRLVSSLFTDSMYIRRNIDPADLIWGLYWCAVDLQNTEQDVVLTDIFEPEELFNLWRVFNYDFYIHNTSYPRSLGLHVDNANNLLANILDTADAYIEDGRHGATLRFAHDGNIIPLVAKMQLEGCYGYENDPYKLHTVWTDYKIAPMASNLQMVFFRNRENPDDILVKFMLNERETAIPVATSTFPYYKWSDAKAHLRKMLDTPAADYMPADMKK